MSVDALPAESVAAVSAAQGAPDLRRELLATLVRSRSFVVGTSIIAFWMFCAILGPTLTPHSPYAQDLLGVNQPPSGGHWFGTDQLGRDMFARVIAGARDIIITAPLATLLGTALGAGLGMIMGYCRGIVDAGISRVLEALLALPLVVFGVLGVIALGTSNITLIVVIGIVFAPVVARTVRAAVLQERDLDYVAAARLRGESSIYIMLFEILPNVMAPIMVEFTVRLGYAVFTLVTLSFLGFGLQPPSANWGADIQANFGVVGAGYWWGVLFDVLAIASLVVAANMIASSIESALEDS